MTNDEKAKAYDKALEQAKFYHGNCPSEPEKKKLEKMFPALRESEDERIRKWLADYFSSIKKTVWIHRDITCEQILDWLEKQKEKKPIGGIYWHAIKKGEKLPCRAYIWNPDYEKYHDCWEGRLIPNLEKICVGADTWYLPADDVRNLPREGVDELQKENPKSAISIPADCATNAKCEDRWHKTANSLPDDGRDVLAKDALGNYLLASFDGAQWFVSVYDGEDHPVLHTPPILEWCEIPSEKQKEQKPAEKQDYSGLNDLERAIHRGFLCAGVENVPVTIIKDTAAECMGFLALIEPKPAWSEDDEKMLDSVIQIITHVDDLAHEPTYAGPKWTHPYTKEIAWLKSLRPSWKPSEEQMEVLLNAEGLVRANNYNENAKILASLYEQLKKL